MGLQPLLPGLCGFVSQNRVLQLCIPKASLLSVHALMTGAGEACLTSLAAGAISGDGPSLGNSYGLAWDDPPTQEQEL